MSLQDSHVYRTSALRRSRCYFAASLAPPWHTHVRGQSRGEADHGTERLAVVHGLEGLQGRLDACRCQSVERVHAPRVLAPWKRCVT
jgi:hypothetical protein